MTKATTVLKALRDLNRQTKLLVLYVQLVVIVGKVCQSQVLVLLALLTCLKVLNPSKIVQPVGLATIAMDLICLNLLLSVPKVIIA